MTKTKMPKESWGRYIHDERKKKPKYLTAQEKLKILFLEYLDGQKYVDILKFSKKYYK